MALLKKIRSATLMEALVATVLIVVVFMIAGMVLNNLLYNAYHTRSHAPKMRLHELVYLARHHKISLPYSEDYQQWEIHLLKEKETSNNDKGNLLQGTALNRQTGKEITISSFYEK